MGTARKEDCRLQEPQKIYSQMLKPEDNPKQLEVKKETSKLLEENGL